MLPELPYALWLLLPVTGVVFVAAVVQFGLGFGFGMMAAPMLALIDPAMVPVPVLLIGFATSAMAAWRERSAIAWGEVWTGVWGRAAGVGLATLILIRIPDRDTFAILFGALIALAVLMSVVGLRLPFRRGTVLGMATLSGLMGTITSVGAPPMAIVYQDRPGTHARPTLAAFFAIGCVLSLVGLWGAGWAGSHDLVLAAVMLPGMLAGYAVSGRLRRRFDARYRGALLVASGVAAAVLVIRGLT